MALMDWDDHLSVGVEMIDHDHRYLVSLVNELHEAVRAARGKLVLGHVLEGLITSTQTHFAREEAEMARSRYPQAPEHIQEHTTLARQLLDVQARYMAGNAAVLSMEVLAFLKDWLLEHIQGSDEALGAFLTAQKSQKVA